jgi:hypothetical protein
VSPVRERTPTAGSPGNAAVHVVGCPSLRRRNGCYSLQGPGAQHRDQNSPSESGRVLGTAAPWKLSRNRALTVLRPSAQPLKRPTDSFEEAQIVADFGGQPHGVTRDLNPAKLFIWCGRSPGASVPLCRTDRRRGRVRGVRPCGPRETFYEQLSIATPGAGKRRRPCLGRRRPRLELDPPRAWHP